jgi:hypothetical protein
MIAALYIPLLWYFIGKRLDRVEGSNAAPISGAAKVRAICGLAVFVCVGLLMFTASVMNDRFTIAVLLLAWVCCGILATSYRIRRSPVIPKQNTS